MASSPIVTPVPQGIDPGISGPPPTNLPNGPVPNLSATELQTVTPQNEPWSDTRAMQIALGDFQRAEGFRQMNHDQRFRIADRLYLAYKEKATWEGTKMPRSSISIFLTLEQVQSLTPSVINALFPDNNQLPFDVVPTPTSTVQQAKAVRDLLFSQLQDISEPGKYLSVRELLIRAKESAFIYGNGIIELGILDKTYTRVQHERVQIPVRTQVDHPQFGPMVVPTGEFTTHVRKTIGEERVIRPMMSNVDIRDFYIDPNCTSHNIQDANFCATRHLLTVNQIMEMKDMDGIKMPSLQGLLRLAKVKQATQGDNSKQMQSTYQGFSYQPTTDYSTDPNLARLEMIRYFQKGRIVYMLGRQWCMYNEANEYGILPFLNDFYIRVPGRFYCLSVADLVEPDQKLAEAIINGRIDELNLLIHPPIIKKQGRAFSQSQQRLRPGVIWEADDPDKDYRRFEMGNVTAAAYVEVQALEQRVQKKTGVTDLSQGVASAGGNSALRSATGVSQQAGSTDKKIQYLVSTTEDQVIVPMLSAMHAMNQIFLDPNTMVKILGPEMQQMTVDPVEIFNASVKFSITASGKMKIRQSMASGGLGLILQTYLNPELQQEMLQLGKVIDVTQVDGLVCDTFGITPMSLWRDASQQEIQQIMAMKMAPQQAEMAKQQARLDSATQNRQETDETKLLISLLSRVLTPDVAHSMINEIVGPGAGGPLPLPSAPPPVRPTNGA